ncbi:MAG: RtcB family protein, partial [Chloroflexota bacterium]
GGDLDESPQAYKDIHAVMEAQSDLVDIVGKFSPRIVRMDGGGKSGGKGKKAGEGSRKSKKKRR